MSRIQLGNVVVTSYENGWIVADLKVTEKGSNPGREYEANPSYHGNIGQALNAALERKLRASDATTMEELREVILQFRAQLTMLFEVTVVERR